MSKRPRRYLRQMRCPAADVREAAVVVQALGPHRQDEEKARRRWMTGRRRGLRETATLSDSINVH